MIAQKVLELSDDLVDSLILMQHSPSPELLEACQILSQALNDLLRDCEIASKNSSKGVNSWVVPVLAVSAREH
jgi:hypothetical protein